MTAPMTSEVLRQAIADKVAEYTGTPDGSTKYVIAQQILQLIATSKPGKKKSYASLPSEDFRFRQGWNAYDDTMEKLLGGGDNG